MSRRRKVLVAIAAVVVFILWVGAVRVLPVFTGPALPAGATRLHITTAGPNVTFGCLAAMLAPVRVARSGDDLGSQTGVHACARSARL